MACSKLTIRTFRCTKLELVSTADFSGSRRTSRTFGASQHYALRFCLIFQPRLSWLAHGCSGTRMGSEWTLSWLIGSWVIGGMDALASELRHGKPYLSRVCCGLTAGSRAKPSTPSPEPEPKNLLCRIGLSLLQR